MAEGWEPYGITTEAGKSLFTRMNMEQGSSVWGPVGEGIVAVEREVSERIIKLLETDMEHAFGDDGKCLYTSHHREVCNCDLIALIKGEN